MSSSRCTVAVETTLIVALASLLGCAAWEITEDHFPTLGKARSELPIPELYIPAQFPDTATDVSIRRWADPHSAWMRFEFNQVDLGALVEDTDRLTIGEIRELRIRHVDSVSWWADELRNGQLGKAGSDFRFQVYRVPRLVGSMTGRAFIAIDPERLEAFYWQESLRAPG
ncbi:MAG: hypothetical protein R3344_00035 [Acidobacteriota bacterium]|nr:hypothetical protein [Acidobacteriota bacterium]